MNIEHLTWHHVFGRMHIIAEPWASFAPLTLMLCGFHHLAVHSDHDLRLMIERLAIKQFCDTMGYPSNIMIEDFNPVAAIRTMVRLLEKEGVLPHGYTDT